MPYEVQLEAKEREMFEAVKKVKGKLMNFLPKGYRQRIPELEKKLQDDKERWQREAEDLADEPEDYKVPMNELLPPKDLDMAAEVNRSRFREILYRQLVDCVLFLSQQISEHALLAQEIPKAKDRLQFRYLRDLAYLPKMYVFHAAESSILPPLRNKGAAKLLTFSVTIQSSANGRASV